MTKLELIKNFTSEIELKDKDLKTLLRINKDWLERMNNEWERVKADPSIIKTTLSSFQKNLIYFIGGCK